MFPPRRKRHAWRWTLGAVLLGGAAGCEVISGLSDQSIVLETKLDGAPTDGRVEPPENDAGQPVDARCVTGSDWQLDCVFGEAGIMTLQDDASTSSAPLLQASGAELIAVSGGANDIAFTIFATGGIGTPSAIYLVDGGVPVDMLLGNEIPLGTVIFNSGPVTAQAPGAYIFPFPATASYPTTTHIVTLDAGQSIVAVNLGEVTQSPETASVFTNLTVTDAEGGTFESPALLKTEISGMSVSPPTFTPLVLPDAGPLSTTSSGVWIAPGVYWFIVTSPFGTSVAHQVQGTIDGRWRTTAGLRAAYGLRDGIAAFGSDSDGLTAQLYFPASGPGPVVSIPPSVQGQSIIVERDVHDVGYLVATAVLGKQLVVAHFLTDGLDAGAEAGPTDKDLSLRVDPDFGVNGIVTIPLPDVYLIGKIVRLGTDICVSVSLGDASHARHAIACIAKGTSAFAGLLDAGPDGGDAASTP